MTPRLPAESPIKIMYIESSRYEDLKIGVICLIAAIATLVYMLLTE